jgi:hypothetical protein
VAGPPALEDQARAAGFAFHEFPAPPADELDEVWSRVPSLPVDKANVVVIRDIFGRLDTTASLPRLLEACEQWKPDVVLRDPAEFGSAIAAEAAGIPHVRGAFGLSSTEEMALGIAAATVSGLRQAVGLAPDPGAQALRRSPYLTLFPDGLEDPAGARPERTMRFRDPGWDAAPAELPDWWPERDLPLVYVTFGSVAGGMEIASHLYATAMQAVADLPVRVLLTVGRGAVDALAAAPANVHVEQWVPQADVLGHASAVVCHGGSGSTLGALAAGLPLVVVPLFADQPYNARQVAATGSGLVLQPDAAAIRGALARVLDGESYHLAARALAAEMRSYPSTDAAVDALERLSA